MATTQGDTVYECSYVETDIVPGCEFFASTVELGPEGVVAVQPLSGLSMYEQDLLDVAIPDIQANITKALRLIQVITVWNILHRELPTTCQFLT